MHKLENMFKEEFNRVKKLISFNPRWVEQPGDFRRVVADRACRYILNVGEVVKMTDKQQRQYILVGTPYGMIAAQRTTLLGKTIVRFETTKALVDAYRNFINAEVNFFPDKSGILLEQGFSYLISQQLQDDFKVIADMAIEAGHKVGDGIKPPRVPREKATIVTNAVPAPNKEIWDAATRRLAAKLKRTQVTAEPPVMLALKSTDSLLVNAAPQSYQAGTTPTVVAPRPRGMNTSMVHYDDPAFIPAPVKAEPYIAVEA